MPMVELVNKIGGGMNDNKLIDAQNPPAKYVYKKLVPLNIFPPIPQRPLAELQEQEYYVRHQMELEKNEAMRENQERYTELLRLMRLYYDEQKNNGMNEDMLRTLQVGIFRTEMAQRANQLLPYTPSIELKRILISLSTNYFIQRCRVDYDAKHFCINIDALGQYILILKTETKYINYITGLEYKPLGKKSVLSTKCSKINNTNIDNIVYSFNTTFYG